MAISNASPDPYYGNRSSGPSYEVERNSGEDVYDETMLDTVPSTSNMPVVTPSTSRASLRRGPSVTFALPPERSYNTSGSGTSTPVKHQRYQRETNGQEGGVSSTAGAVVVDDDGAMVPVEPVLSTSSSVGGAAVDVFALSKSAFARSAGDEDAEPRGRQSLARQRWMKAYKSVCEQLGVKVCCFSLLIRMRQVI